MLHTSGTTKKPKIVPITLLAKKHLEALPLSRIGLYWGYIGIMEKKMETTIVYWGCIGIMEKKMETTIVYWGCIGIMEKKMETTIVYWGCIGIMEKKMETTSLDRISAQRAAACAQIRSGVRNPFLAVLFCPY